MRKPLSEETSSGFLLHAKDFLVAAEFILNRTSGISLPAYYLFGLSVELSLKAFLLSCGTTPNELKSPKFGHNLAALLDEAQRCGLKDKVVLDQQEFGVVKLLSYDYLLGRRLAYRVTGGKYHLPLIEVTEAVARKLVFGLETICTSSE